jgi:hypothetical protein
MLQKFVELGIVVTKVHRVLEFDQRAWMNPWIAKNTQLRTKAKNNFEKDFYKLLNNACFGKSMENVRKRVNMQLLRESEVDRYVRAVAKPSFASRKIFAPPANARDGDENSVVAVQSHKTRTLLNKPIYVGVAVLDLSKLEMVEFIYDEMKPRYGSKVKVLYTDTDSFVLEFKTDDLYADMLRDAHLYDTSNYKSGPLKEHSLEHPEKTKKVGLMKDEYGGRVIHSFVGLKPKMYTLKGDGEVVTKAKGVQRSVVKKELSHGDYWSIVNGGPTLSHTNVGFRTTKHVITTCRIQKTSLSALDTKRWVNDDGISSYPYGHYATRELTDWSVNCGVTAEEMEAELNRLIYG